MFTSPTPDDLVEHVERCYREGAGGAAFEWGPHPNGREEQALRGLVDLLGEAKARALIATAFAPGFPQHGSLLGLQHDRNRLLQKAERMKAKATGPPTKGRATEADKDHSNQKVIRHADGFEELDLADGN